MSGTLELLEQLVETVGRAFYPDDVVVVLDTLIREKYLRDSDMGDVLNLQTRQLRKTLQFLFKERLVKCEKVNEDDKGHSAEYWFIDYPYFIKVVRYRVYLMRKKLEDIEKDEQSRAGFFCRRCSTRIPAMRAQLLRNKVKTLCCNHCCLMDRHENCTPSREESLVEFDNKQQLQQIKAKINKLNEQLKGSETQASIYDLGKALKGRTLPTNLPSENKKLGVGLHGHKHNQDGILNETQLHKLPALGSSSGNPSHRISDSPSLNFYNNGSNGPNVVVKIENESSKYDLMSSVHFDDDGERINEDSQKKTNLPSFLQTDNSFQFNSSDKQFDSTNKNSQNRNVGSSHVSMLKIEEVDWVDDENDDDNDDDDNDDDDDDDDDDDNKNNDSDIETK